MAGVTNGRDTCTARNAVKQWLDGLKPGKPKIPCRSAMLLDKVPNFLIFDFTPPPLTQDIMSQPSAGCPESLKSADSVLVLVSFCP